MVYYDMTILVTGLSAMREMHLKDVKAALSSVVNDVQHQGEVVITRHGKKAAVIVSWDEWKRVSDIPSFARLLMSSPLEPGDIPERDRTAFRDVDL